MEPSRTPTLPMDKEIRQDQKEPISPPHQPQPNFPCHITMKEKVNG